MKPHHSILLALVIGASFIALDASRQKRIATLQSEHKALFQQAPGIDSALPPDDLALKVSAARRSRRDQDDIVLRFLTEAARVSKLPWDIPDTDAALARLCLELRRMNADQLLSIATDPSITNNPIKNRILIELATKAPEKLLALGNDQLGYSYAYYLQLALGKLAASDPLRAQDWLNHHTDRIGRDRNSSQQTILNACARTDPTLAFQILNALPAEDRFGYLRQMIFEGSTSENWATLVPLCRDLVSQQDSSKEELFHFHAFSSLADSAMRLGYEDGTRSIAAADLTKEEKTFIAKSISYSSNQEAPEKWIVWIGNNLEGLDLQNTTRQFITSWAQSDYRAAEAWLASAPDSPAKHVATQAYAQQLASFDPHAAVEWASTLTDPQARDRLNRHIYTNWPANDPEGRAAFGKQLPPTRDR